MKKWIILIIFLIGTTMTCKQSSKSLRQMALPEKGLCAHRGAMLTHPENTIAAFQAAIRAGAQMIEFDVYLTRDEKLVVIHDRTVDRTTNGTGLVSELTLQQIKELDAGSWKSPEFAGENVPTLKEVLAVMPENIWLNVHLKGGRELGAAVAREIVQVGRLRQTFVAGKKSAAEGAKKISPEILICNMERQAELAVYVKETIDIKADFIQLYKATLEQIQSHIQALKAQGVRINFCCTDDPELLQKLFAVGVDFPLINDIAASMEAVQNSGIQPWKPVFRKAKN